MYEEEILEEVRKVRKDVRTLMVSLSLSVTLTTIQFVILLLLISP